MNDFLYVLSKCNQSFASILIHIYTDIIYVQWDSVWEEHKRERERRKYPKGNQKFAWEARATGRDRETRGKLWLEKGVQNMNGH